MYRAVGRLIATIRREMEITQTELAARIGVAQSTLSRWESEREAVPERYHARIAAALAIPPQDLARLHAPPTEGRPAIPPAAVFLPRRRPRLRTYEVKGTMDSVIGRPGGSPLYHRVASRLHPAALDELRNRFPRDSSVELHAAMQFLAAGTALEIHTLLALDCPYLVVEDQELAYAGDLPRHTLVLRRPDCTLVAVPQVSLAVPNQRKPYRVDFLAWFGDGRSSAWLNLEIDASGHTASAEEDARRALALGLPRLGYNEAAVFSSDFVERVIGDARLELFRRKQTAKRAGRAP